MKDLFTGPRGFTLIELMIVILIIAILVALAVPVYLNAKQNAERRTCQSNLRTVDSAIQSYQAMMTDGAPPSIISDMVQPGTATLKEVPVCPAGSAAYAWVPGNPPSISCPNDGRHTI